MEVDSRTDAGNSGGARGAAIAGWRWASREILATAERQHRELVGKVQAADDRLLAKAIQMPVGPKQMGEVPTIKALWMGVVMHIVHHRGQLSVHLRMMGEKVPSIYGPSLDEPWF